MSTGIITQRENQCGVLDADIHILNLHTRLPFRYGIAEMTALPHLFLRVELSLGNRTGWGIAADHLPPKWFTKDPDTSFRDDIADMIKVIESACSIAKNLEPQPDLFQFWYQIYQHQAEWAKKSGYPPLLAAFGVSLVERALIDAFCRLTRQPFWQAIRENSLGILLGQIHPELKGHQPGDFLPRKPLDRVKVRQTIGLADPLTQADAKDIQLDDGLPISLEDSIKAYGLDHFKIKMSNDARQSVVRIKSILSIIERLSTKDYVVTLDGNELHHDLGSFREFWSQIVSEKSFEEFLKHVLFIEQPVHRNTALNDQTREEFQQWPDAPPIIIDESDSSLSTCPQALEIGYIGTSHKNCKGVLKSVANACLLKHRTNLSNGRKQYLLSSEDLTNIGPIAVTQDICVATSIGINQVERNGHHYFTGLQSMPASIQESVLRDHPDLFYKHPRGYPTLKIERGGIDIGSLHRVGLGTIDLLDPTVFVPYQKWSFDSLEKKSASR